MSPGLQLKDIATTEPKENTKYRIYNSFGVDPEGRKVEFQHFLHRVPEISDGAPSPESNLEV